MSPEGGVNSNTVMTTFHLSGHFLHVGNRLNVTQFDSCPKIKAKHSLYQAPVLNSPFPSSLFVSHPNNNLLRTSLPIVVDV
jgi:hypothetical protein